MKKYFKEIITHPLFSGSIVMVIGSNSINFLSYLYHFIIGRMLGPASYGELASLISLIGLIGIIPGSFGLVIIKYVSSAKTKQDEASLTFWLKSKVFMASLVFFMAILLTSPFIYSFLKISKISYLVLIAVFFLFSLPVALNRSILQGLLKFKEMMISVSIEYISKIILSVFLIYLGFQVGGAILALIISTLLGLYVSNIYLRNSVPKSSGPPSNIKSMLAFAVPVFIQAITITSLFSSDVILVKHFFSSHDAGIYAALSTLGKIIFFAAGPITTVMFPLVSQRKSKGQDHTIIFIYSFISTCLFAVSILAMYWFLPNLAIKLLYGSAYLEASNLLIWFGFFITLFTLSSLLVNYSLSLGKTKVVLLPLLAASLQIIGILLFHQSLYTVISISIIVTALLLLSLLIYSTYVQWGKRTI